MVTFTLNGSRRTFDGDPDMPLLWYLRDDAGLTGTKFGCGGGFCGACTVHVDGQAVRSCQMAVSALAGRTVVTIEGLGGGQSHPVQRAWIAENVPQCGYCQSGMILATVALLNNKPRPTDEEIDLAVTNLCRCGTYNRIRKAIHRAAEMQGSESPASKPTSV